MRFAALLLAALVGPVSISAQVFTFSRDQLIRYTAKSPYDRFPDGRPKVPDALLEKVRGLSVEEVWGVLQNPRDGYQFQYEGNWNILHPGKKLVGRAVTASFLPSRADLNDIVLEDGKAKGYKKGQNQWVIDQLQTGDVLVVDVFGKIEGSGWVGDNLATAIHAATKTGGLVLDGSLRDLEGVYPIDMAVYCRGWHPAAISGVTLSGLNVPVRIGNATVMPGDVVFGDRTGVYFIPPHLVQKIVDRAEETHIHDEWTKQKFMTGKYKSSDLYSTPEDPALRKEYEEYKKKKLGK